MGNAGFVFLAFAAAVVVLFRLSSNAAWRIFVLLAADLIFLGSFSREILAYLPLALFLTAGFAGVLAVRKSPRMLAGVVIGFLALFAWLKKYAFFPAASFLPFTYLSIGLSYILFRVLQMMIEQREATPQERPRVHSYLLHTVGFTTLVSGPIQSYKEFSRSQLDGIAKPIGAAAAAGAVERVIRGYFKTNVLALIFSTLQARALTNAAASPELAAMWTALGFASYPLFLYCNFSGYIDVVIGFARLLNLELPENFDRPFSSDSFIGFWNRWHITLSLWLRQYVYTPLVMSAMRRYPAPRLEPVWAVLAFFVTFFLIGAWHGQTAAFLFFGVLQGLGVSVNKLYQLLMTRWLGRKAYRESSANGLYVAVARGLTFSWFTFTLLWFWSDWRRIAAFRAEVGWSAWLLSWGIVFVAATLILALWEASRTALLAVSWRGHAVFETRYWRTAWATALSVIWLAVAILSNQPTPELVYKTF